MIKKTFDAQSYTNMQLSKAYAGHTTVAAEGGETIPNPLADYYMDLLRDSTYVRNLAEIIPMSAATLEIPQLTAGNAMYVVPEGKDMNTEGGADGASSSYTRTTWASMTLTNYKVGVLTGYSTELAEDSLIDIARMVLSNAALAMAEGEEYAFIWGSTNTGAGELGNAYGVGDPEIKYSGLIQEVPYATSAGVVPVGMGWTSANTGKGDMVINAVQQLLTHNHLNEAKSLVEDKSGNGKVTDFFVPPKIVARMRSPVEFEGFQSLDKIGNKAALIQGTVGDFYLSNIISHGMLPVGGKTDPQTTTAVFVDNATDGLIVGFDRRALVIGQRRAIEVRSRHKFYNDVEELRILERVAFKVRRPEWLVLIGDVKNSAV